MNEIFLIGVPDQYQTLVKSEIENALDKIRTETGYDKHISVAVFESPKTNVIEELGLAGSAIGKKGISIKIDFSNQNIENLLQENLVSSVLHECAHLIWENNVGYEETLLDIVISEGIACFIEKYFFPEKDIPYIRPIENEQTFLDSLKEEKDSSNYNYGEWFFGSGKYPNWLGYRLGFLIVQRYAQHIPLKDLLKKTSKEIYENN